MTGFLKYGMQGLLLVALQVLILNNIELAGYMNPYLYIAFLLLLPANIDRSLLLLIAFVLGFSIDIFENSGGVHASASLVVALIRPILFRFLAGPASIEMERMNNQTLGMSRFMTLAAIAVFTHHFWLFMLESFSFNYIFFVLKRTILSGIFTLTLVYIMQILVYRKAQ